MPVNNKNCFIAQHFINYCDFLKNTLQNNINLTIFFAYTSFLFFLYLPGYTSSNFCQNFNISQCRADTILKYNRNNSAEPSSKFPAEENTLEILIKTSLSSHHLGPICSHSKQQSPPVLRVSYIVYWDSPQGQR